jgi:hypothetical protein
MVLSTLLATVSLLQVGGSVSDNALLDGDKAYLFLPPVPVAVGRWVCSAWSDDGQYLIVVSEQSIVPPNAYRDFFETGKQSVLQTAFNVSSFSIRTGRARELWSGPTRPRSQGRCIFFRGSDVAIVTLTAPDLTTTVLRLTPSTSKAEVVETVAGRPSLTVHKDKLAAVSIDEPPSVRFVPPSGNVFRRQPLSMAGGISFREDGVAVLSRAKAPGKHLTVQPGGDETWVDGLPDFGPEFDEKFDTSRVISHQANIRVPGGPEVPILLAGIRDGKESIVVATGAQVIYSENDLGMLYVMEGSLSKAIGCRTTCRNHEEACGDWKGAANVRKRPQEHISDERPTGIRSPRSVLSRSDFRKTPGKHAQWLCLSRSNDAKQHSC